MRFYAVSAVALTLGLVGGMAYMAFFSPFQNGTNPCGAGTVEDGAVSIGGPFELVDETGRTVSDTDVITKPTLIYFGYTSCPDICPVDAFRNGQAVDLLAERGLDVGSLFISIDPERDTPEVLAEFSDAMHPDMIGLTGTLEQVRAASEAFRTYDNMQDAEDKFYLVEHTAFTYLVFPETGFVDFFRREATPQQIAERVTCFAETV